MNAYKEDEVMDPVFNKDDLVLLHQLDPPISRAERRGRIVNAREEAIEYIVYLGATFAGEFCINRDERDEVERETIEALLALGVTQEELSLHY